MGSHDHFCNEITIICSDDLHSGPCQVCLNVSQLPEKEAGAVECKSGGCLETSGYPLSEQRQTGMKRPPLKTMKTCDGSS